MSTVNLITWGALLYELLTGARPFKARSLDRLLHKIVYATPRPIHALREDVSEEFEEAVMKALELAAAWVDRLSLLDIASELQFNLDILEMGWRDAVSDGLANRWVGSAGKTIGIDKFGASAPYKVLYEKYGITAERIVAEAQRLLG